MIVEKNTMLGQNTYLIFSGVCVCVYFFILVILKVTLFIYYKKGII